MDARQLTCFLAVVDHGGFTRAAEHLLIAQPSLSQTIKGLERELGVQLFHRIGRRVSLSTAGEELVSPARIVLRDLDAARSAIDALRGIRSGQLDLIAMPSPGIEPLTSMIADFCAEHPGITLSVDAAFTAEETAEAVRSGSAEIGLLGTEAPFRSATVDVVHLERQPLVLIARPGVDAFGSRQAIRREDLAGHRVIASQRGSLMRAMLDEMIADGVEVEIAVEVAHRTSILPLVLAGVGSAIMPSSWTPLARQVGLQVLAVEPGTVLHVALVTRPGDLTPAARAFLQRVRARHRPSTERS